MAKPIEEQTDAEHFKAIKKMAFALPNTSDPQRYFGMTKALLRRAECLHASAKVQLKQSIDMALLEEL